MKITCNGEDITDDIFNVDEHSKKISNAIKELLKSYLEDEVISIVGGLDGDNKALYMITTTKETVCLEVLYIYVKQFDEVVIIAINDSRL
ncbi:MAG: hypothetical protein ACRDA5_02325 [Clostridium sp.]